MIVVFFPGAFWGIGFLAWLRAPRIEHVACIMEVAHQC